MATAYLLDDALFVAEGREQVHIGLMRLAGMLHCMVAPGSEGSDALFRMRSQADAFSLANEDCDLVAAFVPGTVIEPMIPANVTEVVSLHLRPLPDGPLGAPRVTLARRNRDGFSKIAEDRFQNLWDTYARNGAYPIREVPVASRDHGEEILPLHTSSAALLRERGQRLLPTLSDDSFEGRMVNDMLPELERIHSECTASQPQIGARS